MHPGGGVSESKADTIAILMVGDVVGKAGRTSVRSWLPRLRLELKLDLIIVNGENAAGGIGISPPVLKELLESGADVITSGNHIWKFKELHPILDEERRVLRPLNYPPGAPGRGETVITLPGGARIGVVNLQGRVFMAAIDCPFRAADALLTRMKLRREVDALLVDFHAEATSEKMAMATYLDGRVSAVMGTHTHVPTADCRILPRGTGAMSDLGMTGCYDSIIGMKAATVIPGVLSGLPGRFEAAECPATLCGAVIHVDRVTGLCRSVTPVRRGGILSETY